MHRAAEQPQAPAAVRTDLGAIFVSLELIPASGSPDLLPGAVPLRVAASAKGQDFLGQV